MVGFRQVELGENVTLGYGNSVGHGTQQVTCVVPSVSGGNNTALGALGQVTRGRKGSKYGLGVISSGTRMLPRGW